MKKHFVLALVLLAASISAEAFDYPYLKFTGNDGSESYIGCEGLNLSMVDGRLVADNGSEKLCLDVVSLSHMCFATDAKQGALIDGAGVDTDHFVVRVYDLSGMRVGEFDDVAHALAALPFGIYIVEQAGKVTKLLIK